MLTDIELTAIKANVLQSYATLRDSLDGLCDAIRADEALPIWMKDSDIALARRNAITGITSLFTVNNQHPNETINCLGVIGASADTLTCIAKVNANKTAFKMAMAPLSKQQRMAPDPDNPEQNISTPLARIVLRDIGLGSLLQRQVTRQLVALDHPPLRVGFTMTARSPSVVRISIDEARNRLIRLGDDYSIKQQLLLLDKLEPEEKLAVVIPIPEHVRQNVTYLLNGKKQHMQKKTSLPLFYPANAGDTLPIISTGNSTVHKRARVDREIEDQPFLPAIHAYRYIASYREMKATDVI